MAQCADFRVPFARRNIAVAGLSLLAALTASLSLVLAQPAKVNNVKPLGAFELAKYQYCGSDADCVKAVNGCCDCANGGQDVAVNRDKFEEFRLRFECSRVVCGNNVKIPECGSGVVSCIDHQCRYIEADDEQEKF